jgi:hypothetical protein
MNKSTEKGELGLGRWADMDREHTYLSRVRSYPPAACHSLALAACRLIAV